MAGILADRVALITGAGRGQGLAGAKLFAKEGAKVVITDLDNDSVSSAVAEIERAGGKAVGSVGDASKKDDVIAALKVAKDAYGKLDILYVNHGVGFSAKRRLGIAMDDILNTTEEDWNRIVDINLTGPFLFTKYALPMLFETKGVIINTASIAALRGGPTAHAYAVTKAGVVMLTKLTAATYGPKGIRCNAILPGVIDTEMIDTMLANNEVRTMISQRTPVGRLGTADDIAQLALYLASDASSFMSGQAIAIDGGSTA
jgi:NAD(P)-dependent dehydrogenase (short-subunit alcohol dehydrogenase family)